MKTTPNENDVVEFIETVENEQRKEDCKIVVHLMQKITNCPPVLWGKSIVGFGSYHYKYKSGREGDSMLIGFSPRKNNLSIYTLCELENNKELLKKLGKHKTGKSCLYIKNLADIDLGILEQLLRESVDHIHKLYN